MVYSLQFEAQYAIKAQKVLETGESSNAAKELVFDLIVFHTLHVKRETFVCGSQNSYLLAV